MTNLFRKNQKTLTLIITILVIIAFVWLYNSTQFEKIGQSHIARMYGRGVSQAQVDRLAKRYDLAAQMGLIDHVQLLSAAGPADADPRKNFAYNSIVLEHEADALGIDPTPEQIAAEIREMPQFQTSGQFDFQKFQEFSADNLAPRGFSDQAMEEVVANALRMRQLQAVLAATTPASEERLREEYGQAHRRRTIGVVRLKLADLEAQASVSDEDVQKAYEERKEIYKTEEKRVVEYVAFALSEDERKLPREEQIAALQKAADRAGDFAAAIAEEGATFAEEAAKLDVTPQKTEPFAKQAPPEPLAGVQGVADAAFALTPENPNSDPLTGVAGFYQLHLGQVEPSRPLTLEEARPQILEDLKNESAQEMLTTKVAQARPQIEQALREGKPLDESAKAAGLKGEIFPERSLAEWPRDEADASPIVGTAIALAEGALSPFVPTADGGLLVWAGKVQPLDEERFNAEKGPIAERMAQTRQMYLFYEWLRSRRAAALPEPAPQQG